jgi:hypothetical protein
MRINRRTLMKATSAAATFFASGVALAKPRRGDVELRGTVGRLERLGSLELESQQDFLTGFRQLRE